MDRAPISSADDSVEVPAQAMIQCPLVRFELRPVADCADCPKFAGLEDRFPGANKMTFQQRYVVKCSGEPVKRTVLMIAAGYVQASPPLKVA